MGQQCLGNALVGEAPLRRREGEGGRRAPIANVEKQSFQDKGVPKLELGNESSIQLRLYAFWTPLIRDKLG